MSSVPAFLTFFAMCLGYALVRGGSPERLAGLGMLAALAGSASVGLITIQGGFLSVPMRLVAIDLVLALFLTGLSLRANRLWLIGAASCQWLAIAVHLVKLVHPAIVSTSYAFLTVIWSWPITALLALGTYAHRQRAASPIPNWRASFHRAD